MIDWDAIEGELRARHAAGETGRAIAAHFKVSENTMRWHLRKLGLSRRRGKPSAPSFAPPPGGHVCPKRATVAAVLEAFGVAGEDVFGRRRTGQIVLVRHVAYTVLRRRFPTMSMPRIAALTGRTDHSTILYGIRKVEALEARDPELRATIAALVAGEVAVARPMVLSPPPRHREAIEAEVITLDARRAVKAKNALATDDADALRRKAGSDELSRAIAAAGGWR